LRKKRPNDGEWFDVQFAWRDSEERYGIALPALPSDEVQTSFNGLSGRQNLLQAFEFYKVAKKCIEGIDQPRILDFGSGWGRVSRLFLRETKPGNLYLAETRDNAVQTLEATGNPCNIIHHHKFPPMSGVPTGLNLIYAYSVFSHLSENYFVVWMEYFLHMLKPGGHIVFTSRGRYFIEYLQTLRDGLDDLPANLTSYVRSLCEVLPTPARIDELYSKGKFQWYPLAGGGSELSSEYWGEAFIPKRYLESNYGPMLVSFAENTDHVDQSIVIIKKPLASEGPNGEMLGPGAPRGVK
jgi:hypothetical protein